MTNIINQLQRLMPQRAVSTTEARHLAEIQAQRLRRALGVSDALLTDIVLTALPNLHVEKVADLEVSGATRKVGDTWIILLNRQEATVRQRFSLAHEIKHVLDDRAIDQLYPKLGYLSANERAERVCDYFAACLLMPRPWVKRAWTAGVQDHLDLAKLFEVSLTAMRIRLQQIGLIDRTERCPGVKAPLSAEQLLAA